jgi:hypothetical protein
VIEERKNDDECDNESSDEESKNRDKNGQLFLKVKRTYKII